MENTYNIIHVDFKGERIAQKYNLWQYDYNQILQISSLSLPATVEIHFSLTRNTGETETRVATTKNGITQVQIPNELLRNDGKSGNYSIFAFIYVVDEDSGNTEYEIILHVKSRPAPGEIGEDPEEKRILDEAVNAVNAAAERAETAEAEARSAADSATAAAESARKSAEEVVQEKNTAISAIQNQQTAAEKAITDHTDTEIIRQNAATKEVTDVLTGQINKAGTAESELKTTAEDAGKKKIELEEAIGDADTVKEKVDNSTELAETTKQNLDKSVQEASDQNAELDKTVTRAEELDTSLGEKISEATQLKSDLQTTGEEAVAAINAAGKDNLKQINEAAEKITENIENLTPNDQTVGKNPWSSKQIVDALCPEFTENGNPVTCYPVENYPLDIVASWKPIQDGSGNPYPAGCGPNLLDCSQLSPAAPGYCYGLTVTIDGDVIRIKGVPNITETEQVTSFRYAFIKQDINIAYKVKAFVTKGSIVGITTVQSDKSLVVTAKVGAGISVDIEMRVMFYAGEEPSIYYAYENIRPIHGRDNVTIKRCGENVLKTDGAEEHNKVMNGITYERLENGGIHLYGTTTGRTYYCIAKTYVKIYKPIPAGEYTFCPYCKFPDGVKIYFLVNDIASGSLFSIAPGDKVESVTRKISNNVETIDAYIVIDEAGKTVDTVVYPMLAVGSICPSAYATYTEQRICAELSEETSYGGTLNAITGMGTADWTVRTFDGTEAWNSWGVDDITKGVTGFFSYDVDDYDYAYTSDAFSSHTISNASSWGGETIGFGFANENSTRYFFVSVYNELLDNTESNEKAVESWKAYLAAQYAAGTPVKIAYKLAEPIPFQVDGDQIQALKGINNILTDADTVTVTGREDPVHYVDKKFAELSAAIVASSSEAE